MAHSDSLHFNVIDIAYCSSLWLILVHCSLLLLICITTFDNVFVTKDVHMLSLQVCAYSVSPDIIEKINQNLFILIIGLIKKSRFYKNNKTLIAKCVKISETIFGSSFPKRIIKT